MNRPHAAHGRPAISLSCCLAAFALSAGCSNGQDARKAGITPAYDKSTGRLTELAYDADHDGKTDTWTEMDGARPIRTRIDRNGDGKPDRWEYYDEHAKLTKVGLSRKDDGKADSWAFAGPDGNVERVEVSSAADEKKIDRWEHYGAAGLTAVEEDTNRDGVVDKWETYEGGVLRTAAFDEDGNGKPDRRLTYAGGVLVSIESEPDAAGNFTRNVDPR